MSIWGYGRERNGILGNMLNTHPVALKHVMPAMMHFYIGKRDFLTLCDNLTSCCVEVEQTGASSQFYDKFSRFLFILYGCNSICARCQAEHFFHFENCLEQPRSPRSAKA